jgi:hypothetical protein
MSALASLAAIVPTAVARYADLPAAPLHDESITPETFYLATPNRVAYPLGWLVAAAIVDARYLDSALDVLPVFHPEHGWDRFLITRRVSCRAHASEAADKFGLIMLSGDDAPRLTTPGGRTRLALGDALRDDPERALREVLAQFPALGLSDGRHGACPHRRALHYPLFYRAVADLISQYPGLVASREIYIDDQVIDGQYHPLYLHAAEVTPRSPDDRYGVNMATTTYNWFQLQYAELFAFFDIYGERTVYHTDHGTWSRVRKPLKDEPTDRLAARIRGWLRLDAQPDPAVD